MRQDPHGPGVVLAPHPDDAVLSAWSSLRAHAPVRVVNVFTGIPPTGTLGRADRSLGVTDSVPHMRVRLDEDAEALALAGCDAVGLGLLDSQYRDEDVTVDELRAAMERAVPDAAWLRAPAGLGGYPDHTSVRDAALACALEADIPIALYADFPFAIEWGWPHWVTGLDPRPFLVPDARWDRFLDELPIARDRLVPRVERFDAAESAAKLRALETYRTQFTWLNAGPLDRLRNPEIIGFELQWDVRTS